MSNNKQTIPAPRPIELLAPARDAATAIEAIRHGADAVYMGASSHGARQSAANTVDDIAHVARYAHQFGAKVYVTVNTIIYDRELEQVRKLVWELWRAGADALIVQDMALLEMDLPPIALHASTQCDTRTPQKAKFLSDCGFSQIVLARELSAEEIAEIHRRVDTPLEVFVHGALCVSFSGDCQASWMVTGRSANRGECAQICRLPFDLEDETGRKIIRDRHLLSLRDLNRSAQLAQLLEAGASSLKIEGRLKDTSYVKNVVAAYRRALDAVIDAEPGKYVRASFGRSETTFQPDLEKSFNRGYSTYFLTGLPSGGELASFRTPKWVGERVGKVCRTSGKIIEADLDVPLNNGDGIGFFNTRGEFEGFRVNRVEGNRLFPASPATPPAGAELFRNNDIRRNTMMQGATARRTIAVEFTLRATTWGIALEASDETGSQITVARPADLAEARTSQTDGRRHILEKTGDTIYRVTRINDRAGNVFIPASVLTSLRRDAISMLLQRNEIVRQTPKRIRTDKKPTLPEGTVLSRHDNIANRLAAKFYRECGYKEYEGREADMPKAIEIKVPDEERSETRVMECRYCLRRELGACLKTSDGKKLPNGLYLTSGRNRFRLEFDCGKCLMRVWYQNLITSSATNLSRDPRGTSTPRSKK